MIALMLLLAAADTKIVLEPITASPLSESETARLENTARNTVLPASLRKRLTIVSKASNATYSLRIALTRTSDAFNLTVSVMNSAKVVATVAKDTADPLSDVPTLISQALTKAFGEATPQLTFESEVKSNVVAQQQTGRHIGVVIGKDPNNALAEALRTDFGFTISTLVDEQATRENTVKRIKWLAEQSKPIDHVIIILAGAAFDLTNDDIGLIQARHVLLSSKQTTFAESLLRVLREDKNKRVDVTQVAEALTRAGAKPTMLGQTFLLERIH